MSLALAFKRTAHFYEPPLRRWVARNVQFAFFWVIGLATGLYSGPVDTRYVSAGVLAGLLSLFVLKKWAGDPPTPAASHAP
jgi:hypothetical protein